MNITPIKTEKITPKKKSTEEFLVQYVKNLPEQSILVITSKVISLLEGNIVPVKNASKTDLIKEEADFYLKKPTQYGFILTIKNNILVPTSGIDESNSNKMYTLWPKNPQKSANTIREFLVSKFKRKYIGVIITDSKTTPLRWGTSGICIAHSGFKALNNYIGKKDIFGRKLKFTKANIYDSLASASVVVMGEGNEQKPLACITNVPFVQFQKRNPTKNELASLKITISADLYSELLTRVTWVKGKKLIEKKRKH